MSRISDKTFSQKRHRNGQQVREKMFNITNPQGNADQNHNEVSMRRNNSAASTEICIKIKPKAGG